MEKSCPPSLPSSTRTSSNAASSSIDRTSYSITSGNPANIQSALRQLNKTSYKISKPSSSGGGTGGAETGSPNHHKPQQPQLPPPPPPPPPPSQLPPSQPQPPVYNIHKNDFRDVVQKLTGFPANHTPSNSTQAAAGGGGTTSSRLQKIRPPPLAQLTTRPPPPLAPTGDSNPLPQPVGDGGGSAVWARTTPLSPLPPFPAVSSAAESPITAYMRCLRSGAQGLIPSPSRGSSGGLLLPPAPSSPLGFGCVPSPRSAYQGMLPPGFLFPPSPTPSPRCGDQ